MAEENPTNPTPLASEPPKADPLAKTAAPRVSTLQLKPVAPHASVPTPSPKPATLKLTPKAAAGAAAHPTAGTVKLVPKPAAGAASALAPAGASPLKPAAPSALKPAAPSALKPAAPSALKPAAGGMKLPPRPPLAGGLKLPSKPLIRKPGAGTVSLKPAVPKPPAAAPTPTVPAAPAAASAPAAGEDIRKPMEALKAVTQKLKGLTQPMPQQAILKKTGIISDPTAAQKQASKSKTSRISLSDAMGVAPVTNERPQMKTIRIKRPTAIGPSPAATAPVAPTSRLATAAVSAAAASAPEPAAPVPAEAKPMAEGASDASVTQKRTLKISRPGSPVRPAGKLGLKKPEAAAPAPAATDDVADIPEDIPDLPAVDEAPAARAGETVADVPKALGVVSVLVQAAACAAMGFLAWALYTDASITWF